MEMTIKQTNALNTFFFVGTLVFKHIQNVHVHLPPNNLTRPKSRAFCCKVADENGLVLLVCAFFDMARGNTNAIFWLPLLLLVDSITKSRLQYLCGKLKSRWYTAIQE